MDGVETARQHADPAEQVVPENHVLGDARRQGRLRFPVGDLRRIPGDRVVAAGGGDGPGPLGDDRPLRGLFGAFRQAQEDPHLPVVRVVVPAGRRFSAAGPDDVETVGQPRAERIGAVHLGGRPQPGAQVALVQFLLLRQFAETICPAPAELLCGRGQQLLGKLDAVTPPSFPPFDHGLDVEALADRPDRILGPGREQFDQDPHAQALQELTRTGRLRDLQAQELPHGFRQVVVVPAVQVRQARQQHTGRCR